METSTADRDRQSDYTFTTKVHNNTYEAIDPSKVDHNGHRNFRHRCFSRDRQGHRALLRKEWCVFHCGNRPLTTNIIGAGLEAAAKAAGRLVPKILPLGLEVTNESAVQSAVACIEKEVWPHRCHREQRWHVRWGGPRSPRARPRSGGRSWTSTSVAHILSPNTSSRCC